MVSEGWNLKTPQRVHEESSRPLSLYLVLHITSSVSLKIYNSSHKKEENHVLCSNKDQLEAAISNELMQKQKTKYSIFSLTSGS